MELHLFGGSHCLSLFKSIWLSLAPPVNHHHCFPTSQGSFQSDFFLPFEVVFNELPSARMVFSLLVTRHQLLAVPNPLPGCVPHCSSPHLRFNSQGTFFLKCSLIAYPTKPLLQFSLAWLFKKCLLVYVLVWLCRVLVEGMWDL